MKKNARLLLLCPAIAILASCSAIAPAPAATPTPTSSGTPTRTATSTPSPSATPDLAGALLPTGQPAAEWNGIPIMPGAIAGEGDQSAYRFSIQADPLRVQGFYDSALAALGWSTFAVGQGGTGALLLFYRKGSETITLSIIPEQEVTLVLMIK